MAPNVFYALPVIEYSSMPPHIRYHSPPGGHVILRRRTRDAYDALIQFLRRCTTWDGTCTSRSLDVSGAGPYMAVDYQPGLLIEEVTTELAQGRDTGGIATFDAGTGQFKVIQGKRTWEVPPDRHEWALDFVLKQPPIAQYDLAPASYSFAAAFLLKHPDGGELSAWPPAGSPDTERWPLHHDCRIYAGVDSSKVHAYFDLVFPLSEPGEPLVDLVKSMRPHMPWRLSKANFRVALPNRGKDGYKLRKIDKALFADV